MIWIYFTIILFCLGASFLNKVSRQNFLWVYFLLVVVYELERFWSWPSQNIYNTSPLAYTISFAFYYAHQQNSFKKTVYTLGSVVILFCLYIFYTNGIKKYSVKAGIALSMIYIFFVLQWFLSQLINVDEISLLKKQAFWVSISLLIWAVFFLFRLIPMDWLNIHDGNFLSQLDVAFQINTIISYFIFFRALLCKY